MRDRPYCEAGEVRGKHSNRGMLSQKLAASNFEANSEFQVSISCESHARQLIAIPIDRSVFEEQ